MGLRQQSGVVPRAVVTVLVMAALALGGCGDSTVSKSAGDPAGDPAGGFQPGDVTPVVLQLEDGPVELAPWTYCLGNGCADGAPPAEPHDVGDPAEVAFTFDRDGWEFDATFRERGRDCARMISVPVETTREREFLVRPAGLAGDWDVDVWGRGDGGDVITTFRWHTPVDGRMPEPASGSVAVLADHDGELDSYGVELFLSNLAAQPGDASALITVTGADGRTATIEPRRRGGCYSEGDVAFGASRSKGLAATEIGAGPFTYVVEVALDGQVFVGTGEWPTDEHPDIAPHVPLVWEPALPSYAG
jgi:hypothetical protein